jgi:hypothetical protein
MAEFAGDGMVVLRVDLDRYTRALDWRRYASHARKYMVALATVFLSEVSEAPKEQVNGRPRQMGYVPIITGNLRNSARLVVEDDAAEVYFTASYAEEINNRARRRWLPGLGYRFVEGALVRAEPAMRKAGDKLLEDIGKEWKTA